MSSYTAIDQEETNELPPSNGFGEKYDSELVHPADPDGQLSSASASPKPPKHNSPPLVHAGRDGVFANVSAKPSPQRLEPIVLVEPPTGGLAAPSVPPVELPPTYAQVANDSAPSYLEAVTVVEEDHTETVDGLPVGSFSTFLITAFVSAAFQTFGFVVTYLMSTCHAGRNGSKAGFGVTLVLMGLQFRSELVVDAPATDDIQIQWNFWSFILLIVLGWFTILRSIGEFTRVVNIQKLARSARHGSPA